MAHIYYSYDTWWPVVSNISTYKFIFNKIRDASFNLWNNLAWSFTVSSVFLSAFFDWSTMLIVTFICFTALKGISILWRLWMIVTSFYWWLKAIYLFILGDKSWHRPLRKEIIERKRARRAVKKLFPGLSRKKSLTSAQMYQPPTHEENSFQAAIQQQWYTSHFQPIRQPTCLISASDAEAAAAAAAAADSLYAAVAAADSSSSFSSSDSPSSISRLLTRLSSCSSLGFWNRQRVCPHLFLKLAHLSFEEIHDGGLGECLIVNHKVIHIISGVNSWFTFILRVNVAKAQTMFDIPWPVKSSMNPMDTSPMLPRRVWLLFRVRIGQHTTKNDLYY